VWSSSEPSAPTLIEMCPEQVLAEIVEEQPPHGGLEERGAARVAWRVPGILVLLVELHDTGGERWEHDLEIASDRGHHAPSDEGRRVLQRPDVFVHHLHHVDGD